jgi:hypothetical protein
MMKLDTEDYTALRTRVEELRTALQDARDLTDDLHEDTKRFVIAHLGLEKVLRGLSDSDRAAAGLLSYLKRAERLNLPLP